MRRISLLVVALALVGALAPSAVLAEDTWAETLRSFKRDIGPGNPLPQRHPY